MEKNDWLVLDSPAGIQGKNLSHALKLAHKIIVPVQPSVFDMVATRDFINRLAEEKSIQKREIFYWYSWNEGRSSYSCSIYLRTISYAV